jgi:23S rRNA (adenine2503-C2)-methyltransferase
VAAATAPTLYDVDRRALDAMLAGEPRYRAEQVWHGLYSELRPIADLTAVPAAMRAHLAEALPEALTEVTRSTDASGDTVKVLWQLRDGLQIETVLMLYRDRATVCVSTQAGCAMGCGFCATGQAGFDRHLSVGEIVEQVVRAQRLANEHPGGARRVGNVVFMGMGEPLANFDPTWGAVRRLHDDLGRSARHLTISTVGVVPGIRRLAEADLPVNLAVSLHAADDALRDTLVPLNRTYPLEALLGACEAYVTATRRRLSFEWAMIDGVNDRIEDAARLAGLARRVRAHVNLIPLNRTPGYAVAGSPKVRIDAFRDHLVASGVNVTVRANRGTDIDAACGQLRASAAASGTAVQLQPASTAALMRRASSTLPSGDG